ncbi:P-loop containing nucleoside triphosphate hydrolase protein [Rhizopogon vinicolor AM-OR11-026]|uniref:p-loop containing nucleoside triphosphate hydrolase protein n=1 Tax=Rhizopogon vinicolor AM-OR11-026 TaxID=1314800 RepID=A0A1B7NHA1_9AGAM|nr:P-loop containing nucleoside triphosphate hydrolase protein [Rhizopogon vinicolor AM-OR11-026]
MQTRSSQGSVLGKRAHHVDPKAVASPSTTDIATLSQQMATPEQSPKSKRARISLSAVDSDSNKENVPPFRADTWNDSTVGTPRSLRSVTRTSTEIISPSRTRSARRRSSTSTVSNIPSTPATSLPALVISTPPPTPPVSLLPVYTRARGLLRSTSTSLSPIACREDERQLILEFITSSWSNNEYTSLYISGTPGTGKTALVNSVLRSLEQSEGTSDLRVISINCMALGGIDALWDRLYEELCRTRAPKCGVRPCKAKGKQAVEKALSTLNDKCVLVLDELDHIASSNQTLSSIFSLSQHYPSTLRVIGIANTHTLTSSLAQVSSREASSALTLHFGSYSSQQLLQVLHARLSPLYDTSECPEAAEQAKRFLPIPTLTLLTKKIASQTGDVRALFEVLRGAIDLAVTGSKVLDPDANPLATPLLSVKPDHILAALKAYLPTVGGGGHSSSSMLSPSSSETVSKVRNLGLQTRLALLCTLLASKRMAALSVSRSANSTPTKSPLKRTSSAVSQRTAGLDVAQLHAYYSSVLTRGDNDIFTPVSRSEFSDLVGMLETVGLVSSSSACIATSPSKTGRRAGRTASFGIVKAAAAGQDIKLAETVRTDEVLRGLGVSDGSPECDVREEEVKAIWARECGRIARESKMKSVSGMGVDKPFDEAFED